MMMSTADMSAQSIWTRTNTAGLCRKDGTPARTTRQMTTTFSQESNKNTPVSVNFSDTGVYLTESIRTAFGRTGSCPRYFTEMSRYFRRQIMKPDTSRTITVCLYGLLIIYMLSKPGLFRLFIQQTDIRLHRSHRLL